ncbi:MAG: flagellar protein FlaG [Solidesulfovibrio sp.]
MRETDVLPTATDVGTSAQSVAPRTAASNPGAASPPSPTADGSQPDNDTVAIEALSPDHSLHFVIDEDTRIIQTEILDATTGEVLQKIPEDSLLKRVAALREDARKAFVDKTA